ncbi:DUF1616 domain-containing protein [Natronoglomus mannanivorans]|uniref:DUF1616 domain-containing protein n=1 Tax=Natronoglomus mannanivorans TaxID=2979990 RepID=UPI0030828A4D
MSLPTATKTRFGYVREYPFDLAITSIAAIAAYLLVTTLAVGSTARLAITLPLVLFLPGYALVTMLFPAKARVAREQASATTELRPGGIDTVERLGLSFALSLAIVPMVVLALGPTTWHLTAESTAAGLVVVTVVLAQLGAIRRLRVPEPERYTVSFRSGLARIRGHSNEGVIGTLSTVVLALGIVAAGLALTVALVAPQPTAGFTEFGLMTEDEDGNLVTDAPSAVEPGEAIPVVLSVDNQEEETMEYTVVAQEQHLEDGEVIDRTELETFDAEVEAGENERFDREVTPTVDNDTVRMTFLLFDEEPPAEPTRADAMEDVYFWVTVTEDAPDSDDEDGDDAEVESDGDDAEVESDDDDAEVESDDDDAEADEEDEDDAESEDDSDDAEADDDGAEADDDEADDADDGADDAGDDDAGDDDADDTEADDDDDGGLDGFFGDDDDDAEADDAGDDDADDDDDSGFTITVGSDDDD